ncbi:MAG: ROK family protein [Clostridiales bacterium]|nr:ROK family protein [Clostridiales bacterium]
MIKLGFDIGGTTVKAGAVDEEYRIIRKLARPTPKCDGAALCLLIADMARELANGDEISALGITVPGSVDKEGRIVAAVNLGLFDFPIREKMEKLTSVNEVIVRNDADAAGEAELALGALKGVNTGLILTIGTGVGGCLVLGGRLFHGGLDRGTELGHAMLDRGGMLCGCGHRGCIETLCSATAIRRLAEAACREEDGMIRELAEKGREVDAKLLIDCAIAGDGEALRLFDEYTDALADAIASFVNILDPEVIVLGGGVSGAGDFILDPLRKKVPEKCFFGSCGKILAAEAGNDAGVIGSLI